MPTRAQLIDSLRAKLQTRTTATARPPLVSESVTYQMELGASQRLTSATLLRIVDGTPLGGYCRMTTASGGSTA